MNADSARSIDLGIRTMDSGYHLLQVLLYRARSRMRTQCLDASIRMLELLEVMVSDSEEPYNGIIWQLMCSPFTPFLILFGEILANGSIEAAEKERFLAAMERFPDFLAKMSLRSSLATKLERVAVVFVEHARSVIHQGKPTSLFFVQTTMTD